MKLNNKKIDHNDGVIVLPGYEHINRFSCREHNMPMAKILPGEYYVTTNEEIIATVLGSCISVCIRDAIAGIGGMNHFMLPENNNKDDDSWKYNSVDRAARYGTDAMEHLINDILKNGGKKQRLEFKVTGGGKIMKNMTDVGKKNISFIKNYLETEGFTPISVDIGSIYPRKVRYFPQTGRLLVKKLTSMHNNTILQRENQYQHKIEDTSDHGDVELF